MKNLVMVKLGGAILTDKRVPCYLRMDTMRIIAAQISAYQSKMHSTLLLGNGGGSFGHYYAKMYRLSEGISGETALLGMCKGKNGDAYLNMRLTECLLSYCVKACSYAVDDFFWKDENSAHYNLEPWIRLFEYLNFGITPVVYGDIIYDRKSGCKIISTEQIFLTIAKVISHNPSCGYELEKIIFCTDRDGVVDLDGNLIRQINRKNFHQWDIFRNTGSEFDVTGGMYGKVKMAMDSGLTCPVQIIDGRNSDNLYRALCGDYDLGTIII